MAYTQQQQYPNQPYPQQYPYTQQYTNANDPYQNRPQQQYPQNPGWNQSTQYNQQPPTAPPHNPEDGVPKSSMGFSEKSIRQAFIRKVFVLVTIMLAVVAIMTAIPFIDKSNKIKHYIQNDGQWLYWVSYLTFLIVYITLMCVEKIRRSFPINIIFAGILTLSIGYMTAMICSMYTVESVLICVVILTVCCACVIIFAIQTKYDITSFLGVAVLFSLFLFIIGIVAIIVLAVFNVHWPYMVYAGLSAILFMVFLGIDIQMIMGGKKYEISPEDYIFAAIQLFLDIVLILWYLLAIFGGGSRN